MMELDDFQVYPFWVHYVKLVDIADNDNSDGGHNAYSIILFVHYVLITAHISL